MAKQKLKRFKEFSEYEHTFDFPYHLKGKWRSDVFHNDRPIVLELGCGKGEYTVALANKFPEKNFVGIDIKSNRMWVGATQAMNEGLRNVALIRGIIHKIDELFVENEIDEIWITFPDPFVRTRSAKHRLTHTRFLRLYKKLLKPAGYINFKTDSDELFSFTIHMLAHLNIKPLVLEYNVHDNIGVEPMLKDIKTYYEKLFMKRGKTIKFTRFMLDELTEESAASFEEWFENERLKMVAEGKSIGL